MAFFDDVRNKLTQAGQTTVQKTQELTELAKLNTRVNEIKTAINNAYTRIGYQICLDFKDNPIPRAAEDMAQVYALTEELELCQAKIDSLKGNVVCVNCGAKLKAGAAFCSECGAKLPVAATPEPAAAAFCSKCGQTLEPGSAFCVACGAKVE